MSANDVMKTGAVTKSKMKSCKIYLSFEELNGVSYSFIFVSNLMHACIPLLLF